MQASVLSFYDAFPQYEAGYQNFLITHTFSANPSYTQDFDEIFAGADPTALMSEHPGLVTALYDMMSEFPWYTQFFKNDVVTTVPLTTSAALTTSTMSSTTVKTTSSSFAAASATSSTQFNASSDGSNIKTSAVVLASLMGLCYIALVI